MITPIFIPIVSGGSLDGSCPIIVKVVIILITTIIYLPIFLASLYAAISESNGYDKLIAIITWCLFFAALTMYLTICIGICFI